MAKKKKIGFRTKLFSMRNYLKEIPVEGKKTVDFNLKLANYDKYVAQVIRIGNCITLLSISFDITWKKRSY